MPFRILKVFLSTEVGFYRQNNALSSTSGKIINVSQTMPGRVHDIKIRQRGSPLPPAEKYADLGYQGIQHTDPLVNLPHKKPKGGKLTSD